MTLPVKLALSLGDALTLEDDDVDTDGETLLDCDVDAENDAVSDAEKDTEVLTV